eukprot:TRINITY_DN22834_c0_g1_i2.p1 TRINITY_DN22834_c0_g1~~TRINITY_DN22834_c0_g1_i2.p1  ORF type:complete len:161 (+),score=39.19 TRINITY_DN22834_c0_g1_i2:95-577(+)
MLRSLVGSEMCIRDRPLLVSPMGLVLLVGLVTALAVLGFAAPFLRAFSALHTLGVHWQLALGLGIVVTFFRVSLLPFVLDLVWGYTGSLIMADQLLMHVAMRMSAEEWEEWRSVRKWFMLGLGIPVWLLVHVSPLLALAGLDLFKAAGAYGYLHERKREA